MTSPIIEHVKIHFGLPQDEDGYPPIAVESVWGRKGTTEGEYVLDNIPFFCTEATLEDVVSTTNNGGTLWFAQVISRSTNSLLRAVLYDSNDAGRVRQVLSALGCSTEWDQAHKLIAISVPIIAPLSLVQSFLRSEAEASHLDYEEPILRQSA